MTRDLEALIADGPDRDLEQGRTKLFLASPPKGFHLRSELNKRHEMWGDGEFEALLVRAESQVFERQRGREGDTSQTMAQRGRRAKQLARANRHTAKAWRLSLALSQS